MSGMKCIWISGVAAAGPLRRKAAPSQMFDVAMPVLKSRNWRPNFTKGIGRSQLS
jgi:hypothetical protein